MMWNLWRQIPLQKRESKNIAKLVQILRCLQIYCTKQNISNYADNDDDDDDDDGDDDDDDDDS